MRLIPEAAWKWTIQEESMENCIFDGWTIRKFYGIFPMTFPEDRWIAFQRLHFISCSKKKKKERKEKRKPSQTRHIKNKHSQVRFFLNVKHINTGKRRMGLKVSYGKARVISKDGRRISITRGSSVSWKQLLTNTPTLWVIFILNKTNSVTVLLGHSLHQTVIYRDICGFMAHAVLLRKKNK